MPHLLWVAVGGALGACARYAAALALHRPGVSLPWATLAVNVAGCLLAGALLGWGERHSLAAPARLFLVTGLLGGFTTFSAFGVETLALWREGRAGLAALNVAANLVLGLGAAALGWRMAPRGG